MAKGSLKTGAKVDVAVIVAGAELELKSSVAKMEGSQWQFSMPMAGGKSYLPDSGSVIVIYWQDEGNDYRLNGRVTGSVKHGVRTYLQVKVEAEVQSSERRAFARIPAKLDVILGIFSTETDGSRLRREYPGKTSDISNGGVAVYTSAALAVGELVDISLDQGNKHLPLRAEVCWVRPAPKTVLFRDSAGLRFLFSSPEENARVASLTAALAAKQ